MPISHLGFEVDSSQAKTAAVDLDKLSGSAERAEKAERGLATASKQAEASAAGLAAINRSATGATTGLASAQGQVATRMTMATTAVRANTAALEINAVAAGKARMQSRQLMYQLVDVGQSLPLLLSGNIYGLQNLGFQIAQIGQLYAGEGGFTAAIRDSTVMVGRFVAKLGPVAAVVGGIGLSFAALRSEINETSKTAVSFGDVALGAWQTLRDAVSTTIQPAINAIAGAFSAFWEWFESKAKEQFNLFIGNAVQLAEQMKFAVTTIQTYWAAGYAAIKAVWSGLPGALGNVVYSTANAVIGGVEAMVNTVTGKINDMVKSLPFGIADNINVGAIGEVKFGRLSNPNTGDAADLRAQLSDIFGTANQNVADAYGAMQDRVSTAKSTDFFGALQMNSVANALKRISAEARGTGKSLKDAAKDALPAWMSFGRATDAARDAMRFVGRTARGFIDDFTNGLKNGESVWRSFADAALNALDRIADKLLDDAFSSLFGYGKGGGLLSSLFGLSGGGTGFGTSFFPAAPTPAIGLFASGTPSAPAGLAIVGEKGPELVRFRGGEEVIPNHRLRAANDYAANQNQRVQIDVNVFVDDDGKLAVIAHQAGGAAADVRINQYDKGRKARLAADLPDLRRRGAA